MIGTSIAEYVFIRACIFFLHNIAPSSLFYCVLLLLQPLLPLDLRSYSTPFLIKAWLLAEAAFFIIVFLPYRHCLQRSAVHPELQSREAREELFERCISNVQDSERYLSQWHLGAKKEHIKRENLKEFIRWAFLNIGQTREEYEEEIESYVRATEKMLGRDIPMGKGSAKTLRLTLDKVDCLHRSLLWYLCIFLVDTKMYCSMLYNGFHFHRISFARSFTIFPLRPLALFSPYRSPVKHLTYWLRPHTSKTRLPVLFIHGIGVGLYPYTNFLRDLNLIKEAENDSEVGIIAIEIMPVSSRITHPALKKDVMVHEIQAILKHHGWSKFVLVSHSYGSIISTHLLKSPLTAPFIGPIIFIDPVSFLLHLPDVAYNFTARQPVHANEYFLWYFGSKDIGVAHTLARRFFWSENIVWKEDLGVEGEKTRESRDVTVVLSGRDMIVDTEAVGQYLTASSSQGPVANGKPVGKMTGSEKTTATAMGIAETAEWKAREWTGSGLEILWFNHLDHGQVFDFEKTRRPIIKAIEAYSTSGSTYS